MASVLSIALFVFASDAQQLPQQTEFTLAKCGSYPKYQQFIANSSASYTIFKVAAYSGSCFDDNFGKIGTMPWVWNCDPNQVNQRFNLISSGNGNNVIFEAVVTGNTCPQLQSNKALTPITMETCDKSNILQQWNVNNNGYIISASNSSYCLTVGMSEIFPNCTVSPLSSYPYCNQQLPTHQRVQDLVSRMTLSEKVQNLASSNPGVPRLGVQKNSFHEALHGVLCGCGAKSGNNTGCPTSFPHATLLGATFNRSLWRRIGEAISTEARSFANQKITGLYYWAPDINLFRDPRWGRGQEVPGEDPYLTGQYVMEYSYFMQNGEDNKYLKVVSTAKHYADYDQEGNYGTQRFNFNANVTMQDQVEYYWPAWRSAIQSAHVASIMCSYPAVNNIPSCGNDYFMNQVAREQWGFHGFFVSDCGAIGDGAFTHYIQQTYPTNNSTVQQYQQARVAIQGGCDANCGSFYSSHLQASVENGIATEQDVDGAVSRIFEKMIDLGKLDYNPPSYYTTYGPDVVDSQRHRDLAQKAAEQGIVLLKNDGNILPLSKTNTNGKSIAMIGPHADATQDMLSNYHGTNTLVNSNSPYDAMKARGLYQVTYVEGCNYLCTNTTGFQAAITAAKNADIAIVFLGLHPDGGCEAACESEGWDRNTIEFPGKQLQLLQQIYAANKNTILILINGGAIDISWPKANIPAIVEAFYPGELGGPALCNILLGSSPAGKLPYTIYDKSLLTARPSIMDMSLRDNGGITYRYYTGTPVYPFGFGLSYTNFTYKYYNSSEVNYVDTKLLADVYRNGYYNYRDAVSFVVEVTNIGKIASDCVVLGFITSENDPDAPLLKLFDFQRTFVDVGQSVNVTLSVTPESISVTNRFGNERIVPGKYNIFMGDYPNNNFVHTHLIMNGKEESIFNLQEIKKKHYATK